MRAWLLVVATGCRAVLGIDDPQLVDGAAAPADDDAGDGCHGTSLVKVCIVPGPTQPLVLAQDATIDTDSDERCGNFGALCVLAGTTVAIDAPAMIVVRGTRPLVLLATEGEATIDGTLDLASHRGGGLGAGADATSCLIGTPPAASGGGFGASYIGAGGNGGPGSTGAGGVAAIASDVVRFAGGCPGGAGSGGALGGDGGGAVYVLGETAVSVRGQITASGAGGLGGGAGGMGGGGGGSGGMIGLEAPTVTVAGGAVVFANGGGGGEGSGGATPGAAGADAMTAELPAPGGSGAVAAGGDGGAGAAAASGALPGGTATNNGGGGGGGGGAGVVWVIGAFASSGVISPAPLP